MTKMGLLSGCSLLILGASMSLAGAATPIMPTSIKPVVVAPPAPKASIGVPKAPTASKTQASGSKASSGGTVTGSKVHSGIRAAGSPPKPSNTKIGTKVSGTKVGGTATNGTPKKGAASAASVPAVAPLGKLPAGIAGAGAGGVVGAVAVKSFSAPTASATNDGTSRQGTTIPSNLGVTLGAAASGALIGGLNAATRSAPVASGPSPVVSLTNKTVSAVPGSVTTVGLGGLKLVPPTALTSMGTAASLSSLGTANATSGGTTLGKVGAPSATPAKVATSSAGGIVVGGPPAGSTPNILPVSANVTASPIVTVVSMPPLVFPANQITQIMPPSVSNPVDPMSSVPKPPVVQPATTPLIAVTPPGSPFTLVSNPSGGIAVPVPKGSLLPGATTSDIQTAMTNAYAQEPLSVLQATLATRKPTDPDYAVLSNLISINQYTAKATTAYSALDSATLQAVANNPATSKTDAALATVVLYEKYTAQYQTSPQTYNAATASPAQAAAWGALHPPPQFEPIVVQYIPPPPKTKTDPMCHSGMISMGCAVAPMDAYNAPPALRIAATIGVGIVVGLATLPVAAVLVPGLVLPGAMTTAGLGLGLGLAGTAGSAGGLAGASSVLADVGFLQGV